MCILREYVVVVGIVGIALVHNMVIIKNWYGRHSNNFKQLVNAIHVAKKIGANRLIFPKSVMWKSTEIIINQAGSKSKTLKRLFFSKKDFVDICTPPTLGEKINYVKFYLRPILNYKDPANELKEKLRDHKTLCIHIRGGDVFGSNPHPYYKQPPLWFYKKIINENQWRDIILISEDNKNPVMPHLEKIYNLEWHPHDLLQDVGILCHARNLVGSVGTFTSMIMFLSESLYKYYAVSYNSILEDKSYHKIPEQIIYERIECLNYIKQWRNTKEQRLLMINYKLI